MLKREATVSHEGRKITFKRILVPMDESVHSRTALEAAVTLAAALQAEINCLYVEDTKLLQLSKYPFFREVCTYECRPRESDEMERDIKLQSERIRQMIAGSIGGRKVTWTFEVRRGSVETVVMEQATLADLTIMGRIGRTMLRSTMGSTVRHIILHGRGLSMFIQKGFRLTSPIMTVYIGSDLSKRALDIGANIAQHIKGQLEIMIPAANREKFQELRKDAETHFAETEIRKIYQPINVPPPGGLLTRLQSMHRELLVLPADIADQHPENVLKLITRIHNPIMLVRDR